MAFLVQHWPVRVPICLVLVVFFGTVTSQDPPHTLDGELYCVSSTFSLTVVEVKGSNSKLLPVSTVTSSLRPPRADLHPSYNSLMIQDDITRTLFIPDTNLIRIIELNSQTEDKIELSSCDPLLLRRFEAVPNETWVLCNPDGVSSSVKLYRLVGGGEKGWTADIPVTINSGNGSLLKDVGFVFRRNEEVYVVVATANQVVWFTPRTNVREMQLSDCGRLLQVTEFSKDSLLFECRQQADEPSSTVHATVMYDLATATKVSGTVLNQGRTSGKIILSEDRQIIGIVASDRIIMELLVDGVRKQMVPLVTVSNNDIHDAFIDTTNGEYTLVYACSGGGVYSYNITAALDGIDVTPQLITKEETVCETDCVGLLSIGDGYFAVGLSEPEGVGWYSLSPPQRIGFASGAPSARLAFVHSMVGPDTVDRTVTEGPEVPTQDEGMSGGVVAAIVTGCCIVILFIAVLFSVAVVASLWIRKRRVNMMLECLCLCVFAYMCTCVVWILDVPWFGAHSSLQTAMRVRCVVLWHSQSTTVCLLCGDSRGTVTSGVRVLTAAHALHT